MYADYTVGDIVAVLEATGDTNPLRKRIIIKSSDTYDITPRHLDVDYNMGCV